MKIAKTLLVLSLSTALIPMAPADAKTGYPTSKYKKGAPKELSNCTKVRKYYPYGITYNHISYQKSHDRDKDKLGCEAKDVKYESWMKNN